MSSRRSVVAALGGGLVGSLATYSLVDDNATSVDDAIKSILAAASSDRSRSGDGGFTGASPSPSATPATGGGRSSTESSGADGSGSATPTDSRFSSSTRQQAQQVGLNARRAVVVLEAKEDGGIAQGTGWFLDERGHIVTNRHVVSGAGEVTAWTLDGTELSAEVVDVSESSSVDIALLKTDGEVPATLPTGESTSLSKGQPLVSVGHPSGVGYWVLSLGSYMKREHLLGGGDTLLTSVPGRQGSSGSPVLTLDGKVVAVVYAGSPETQRRVGSAPSPSNDRVHESLHVRTNSLEVPIEAAMKKIDGWEK